MFLCGSPRRTRCTPFGCINDRNKNTLVQIRLGVLERVQFGAAVADKIVLKNRSAEHKCK